MILDASTPWAMPSMRVAPQSTPPMNTLGAEVVNRSRSQLSRSPKESPPAPVATYTASKSASSSSVLISVPKRNSASTAENCRAMSASNSAKRGCERRAPPQPLFLLEHGDLVVLLGEIQRAGEAGDTRADHGDPLRLGRYDVVLGLAAPWRGEGWRPRGRATRWPRRRAACAGNAPGRADRRARSRSPGKTVASRRIL